MDTDGQLQNGTKVLCEQAATGDHGLVPHRDGFPFVPKAIQISAAPFTKVDVQWMCTN
jgi:hypothetical protein